MRRLLFNALFLLAIAVFLTLGVWQVQRLVWKTNLIAEVDARVHAPVVSIAPTEWPQLTKKNDEYRHVTLAGQFLNDKEAQVYALSELGAGYWVMTPLKADDGTIVYINRGFVPTDHQAPATRLEGQVRGQVTVTGLLRMSENKGWLLSQANDPASDRWYRRDVLELANGRRLGTVAPYFIDADATPNPGGWPKGGMTVIKFPNSHLVYALTWFSLAAMLAGGMVWLRWFRKPDAEA
ncbi:hypothetical protein MMA231_03541 (plasmid) [Asticcacaulis sp. MM231]|uniref:SURF1 family protein n=1 Tax=Asticcacaulis sp. MM231 TaxID=3157666 RepID=UPI0032D56B4A